MLLPKRSRDLAGLAALADPYPIYRALRTDAPVHWIEDRNTAVISRYDDAVFVLRSPEWFSSRAQSGMDPVLLGSDPPHHAPIRRRLAKAFTATEVSRLEMLIRESARDLIARMRGQGGAADLMAGYASPLPMLVMRELLQIDPTLTPAFFRWTDALLAAANSSVGPTDASALRSVLSGFARFLTGEHFPRCIEMGTGLVSDLLTGRDAGGEALAPDHVLSLVRLLAFAGTETTRNLIGNAFLALQRHPPTWDELRMEPRRLPNAVEEVLRFDSPVQLLQRIVVEDTSLHDVALPRGTALAVLLGSANRDERQFPDADRFWIERNDPSAIGFGAGPHFCLGSHLARLEARIALEELLLGWPGIALAEDPASVVLADTYATRGPKRLLVEGH